MYSTSTFIRARAYSCIRIFEITPTRSPRIYTLKGNFLLLAHQHSSTIWLSCQRTRTYYLDRCLSSLVIRPVTRYDLCMCVYQLQRARALLSINKQGGEMVEVIESILCVLYDSVKTLRL